MSRTLFWYVLKDLLRIFLMASGVLAGIMSFGGLLRPLTEHGLSASQVSTLLRDFQPAMTAYSFPIAALFAATMVYGRLSADNELTACRASGISFVSLAAPAAVLGLCVALISLWLLCFIVPVYNLKIEQVIYENMAQLVQNEIERTHQMELGDMVISAADAQVLPPDPAYPSEQRVHLTAPLFISYTVEPISGSADAPKAVRVPREYWTAESAIAYIKPMGEKVSIRAHADQGVKFNRVNAAVASEKIDVEAVNYGPFEMNSPIREQPKFMDIKKLHEMIANPQESKRLQEEMTSAISGEERMKIYQQIVDALNKRGFYDFSDGTRLMRLVRGEPAAVVPANASQLILNSSSGAGAPQVKLQQLDDTGRVLKEDKAVQWRIRADPSVVAPGETESSPDRYIVLKIAGFDVRLETPDEPAVRASIDESYTIPTPPDIRQCETHSAEFYMESRLPNISSPERDALANEYHRLLGKLHGEVHSRAAFSVSCVVLVLIGCALGMMFKSGNFLTAFAVSFVPALMAIALIVTGQQVAGNSRDLGFGLALIWAGNGLVFLLGLGLLGRLQRT